MAVALEAVEDGGDEVAGVEGYGFTWLKVDFEVVGLAHVLDEFYEEICVVVWAGDVVSAAHVEPFDVGEF